MWLLMRENKEKESGEIVQQGECERERDACMYVYVCVGAVW